MQAYDLFSELEVVNALNSILIDSDTTTVGEIIDTQDKESLVFAVKSETITDGAFEVQVFVGNDAAMADEVQVTKDYDVADTLINDTISFADTDDNIVKKVGVVSGKRYARIKIVSTTTTDGGTFSATAIKGNKRHKS
jgi:hypothetical protein